MEHIHTTYEVMLGLRAEMVLDEAIRSYQINKLNDEIDEALKSGNQSKFYELSEQLKNLNE